MYDFEIISNTTHLVPFNGNFKIHDFNSGIDEYNEFLVRQAAILQGCGISNTQLLLDNNTANIVGYFSLCMASTKLTSEEKDTHNINEVCFNSIPSLKIGKLAVDKAYRARVKGYGSYLIQLVRGIAAEANENGIACRFITVDADIQYDKNTISFYKKNGFLLNESYKKHSPQKSISMRLDIYCDENSELEETG